MDASEVVDSGVPSQVNDSPDGSEANQDPRNDPTFGTGLDCPAVRGGLITDFGPGTSPGGFDGGFGGDGTSLSGGTFSYPFDDPYPVRSNFSTGEWHISGDVGDYSGFGLFFFDCNRIDASDYEGISFSIYGLVEADSSVMLVVNTSSNDVSHVWLNSSPVGQDFPFAPNAGRCVPVTNQYDGSCLAPVFTVPVTATRTTIEVRWEQFAGGSPSPSVDPAEITSINWLLPTPVGAGTGFVTPYRVDFYVDDLRFF
jgi:hypothetical protein